MNLIEKVIDKSIFNKKVKIMVPALSKCITCNGTGLVSIPNGPTIVCPACQGRAFLNKGEKKEVEGEVQYVPIAFEKNKERVLQLSITYYEDEKPVNISIPEEDLLGFIESDTTEGNEIKGNQ